MKATNKAATQLIIRQDAKGRPIAFVADSLAKGNMLAWKPSTKDAIVLPLSMYKTTKPIEDEQAVERIAKKYGRTFSTPNVQVRQRLFRGYDKERGNAPVYPLKKYANKCEEPPTQTGILSNNDIERIAKCMIEILEKHK